MQQVKASKLNPLKKGGDLHLNSHAAASTTKGGKTFNVEMTFFGFHLMQYCTGQCYSQK